MSAPDPVVERENAEDEEEDEEVKGKGGADEDTRIRRSEEGDELGDLEKGEVENIQNVNYNSHTAMLHRLNPTNPLRIAINGRTRAAGSSPSQSTIHRSSPPQPSIPRSTPPQPSIPRSTPSRFTVTPPPPSIPRSTPTPQQSLASLNSRGYTNRISLFVFIVHTVAAVGLVGFLLFKGVQGFLEASDSSTKIEEERLLKHYLPQVEAASLLSITLAFAWQKAVRHWPTLMVHVILWSSFLMTLSAGVLLLCFQTASTDGVGVVAIAFAIGNGLYACWVSPRIKFCCKVLVKSLEPTSKFPDLNQPTYCMLAAGFLWMSLWILAVFGALNFYLPPLIIIALVLSLAWTTEVMRNVANLTVSRVISLYYLRGMQSSTHYCFQRALSHNLGSACLASLFVPAIEALRILARGLNLLEGEDEFMFSCAHCCLKVMNKIFAYGNGWAFVQIAAYGKGFVRASEDTWQLFEQRDMVTIVDSDITSSICFLTGVCSGSICVIVVAAWTYTIHKTFVATISVLAFFVGYLMTRIAMALPHACVSCYYVCYAENPENRLFDKMIEDRQNLIKAGRDVVVPTPRVPGGRFVRRV